MRNICSRVVSRAVLLACLCSVASIGCGGNGGETEGTNDAGAGDAATMNDASDATTIDDADDTGSAEIPVVQTREPSDVSSDGATLHGEVTFLGDPPATDYGFCTGTSPKPDDCESLGKPDGEGAFEATFDELTPGKTYYVRAYAENDVDRVYGDDVEFGLEWDQVDTGGAHTCAIAEDGTLWCWGDNSDGQLGQGHTEDQLVPGQVGTDDGWSAVSAGRDHSCALHNNQTL